MEKILKTWQKPKVIVLVRGRPEENVLKFCKFIGFIATTTPEDAQQQACDSGPDSGNCGACLSRAGT